MTKRQSATQIVKTLIQKGYEAYFVGGCVRDMLLKARAKDFDIATSAKPDEVESIFPKTLPIGKAFGVILVQQDGESFEVATFRKDLKYKDGRRPEKVKFANAKADCVRRDFTVNGLFYDPKKKTILDWVDGQKDLKKGIIRTIGSPERRFKEDKLRMLRAIRFSVNLDFKIEPNTFAAIKKMHKQITLVSAERIREELVKMFTGPRPALALDRLDETGLLKVILPEVHLMKNVEQPPQYHPEGDVFVHTRLMMSFLKNPDMILAFGALLHDIGKPKTFKRAKDRIRFSGHDRVGARMTEKLLKRLKFSNEDSKKITSCVEWHMQFKDAPQMRPATLKKMFQRETFETELIQHKWDCMASHKNLKVFKFLKKHYKEMSEEEISPEPLLQGRDLIRLGMKPGPKMGQLLKKMEVKQLNGELHDKTSAIQWVKKSI